MWVRDPRFWVAATLLVAFGTARAANPTVDDFFNDNIVHEISITIKPADFAKLRFDPLDHTWYDCDFTWRYQGRDIVVPNVAVHQHGRGSASSVKPSLHVGFDHNDTTQEFLGPKGLKSVLLRNNTQDPSMLHERVSMLFFRRMGIPAEREADARLNVNGQYFGLYTIVESVNKRFLNEWFGEKEGYLYKFEPNIPFYWEYRGPDPSLYVPVNFSPETHESDPKPGPLVDMIRTINQTSDANYQSAMAPFTDLRLYLSHLAVEHFLADTDGMAGVSGTNNFYLYRLENKTFNRFIAWDKSDAFHGGVDESIFDKINDVPAAQQVRLVNRSLAFPELRYAYLEALLKTAALAGSAGGWFEQEIAREYNQTRASALEDPNKQCPNDQGALAPCTNAQFETEIVNMQAFARQRTDSVRRQVADAGFQVSADAPSLSDGGVVNAATFLAGNLAPGSLYAAFGVRLGSTTSGVPSVPLPTTFAGVSFWINGFPAPLLFVSPGQVNLQIPWEVVPGPATVTAVTNGTPAVVNGALSNTISVNIAPSSPGLFVATHLDGSAISTDKPATGDEVLVVYGTGLGPVTVSVPTGQASPSNPLAATVETPAVTIGGILGDVIFSGMAPFFVGLYQVNVKMPGNVAAGDKTPLALTIGGQSAPPLLIATR